MGEKNAQVIEAEGRKPARAGSHQPVNALITAERSLLLGGPAAHDVLVSVAWSAGILLVFVTLAARGYARLGR
jgi:hypothetical protein